MFTPRLSKPEKGNKYYITKSKGGYSPAIDVTKQSDNKGVYDQDLNVLANCVGWAIGRFHEIGGNTKMDLLKAVNAERFIDYADKSLVISQKPEIGAVMVWSQGGKSGTDGCGHVAIVEKVISDNEVLTSESAYASRIFANVTRKNTNGRWGMGSSFKFLGFILNPYITEEDKKMKYDYSDVSDWAKEDMKWAVETVHLIGGDGSGKLAPKESLTREQMAVICHRLYKAIKEG